MPRLLFSSSAIIWQALILGAPDNVPAGSTALTASIASHSGLMTPRTVEPICMTCEYLSTMWSFSTSTLPKALTRPKSLRPKSTSILCSASSFSSASSSVSSALSSSSVLPLGLVPASGNVCSTPSLSLTRVSGDAPANSTSVPAK